MSNELLFYICGGVLAVSAVTLCFVGLKVKSFPGRAMPIVVVWFAIFVGGATTFAVLHAQDEEAAEAAELEQAGEEIEAAEGDSGGITGGAEAEEAEDEEATGSDEEEPVGGTTLQLAASPTDLAFDATELDAKAGKVTIDFDNPSAIPHNVVIEEDGKELAGFEPIAEGKESVSADLEPGTYTFLCTVPGHAEAGMEGSLVVK
ncbi:MAG TPA: plastocyanin/azurin family copper-binding protein [Solirubrobacterales bacterium]